MTLGACPPQAEDLLGADFANLKIDTNALAMLPQWENAEETILVDDNDFVFRRLRAIFGGDPTLEVKRIDHVSSRITLSGDVDHLRDYLDSSPENSLFIQGVDKSGKTALLNAACERYPAMVELLLQRGADPNFQSKEGKSALMEAALWGRYKNVEYLLDYGADKNLKDNRGLEAIDHATPSDENEEERFTRSGGEHQVYKEDTYTANQSRKTIVSILKDDPSEQPLCSTNRNVDPFFVKFPSTIDLIGPIASYDIPSRNKTIARLKRGGMYPLIAAMSGWSHNKSDTLISGKYWTSEVLQLANVVGHTLTPDARPWHSGAVPCMSCREAANCVLCQ